MDPTLAFKLALVECRKEYKQELLKMYSAGSIDIHNAREDARIDFNVIVTVAQSAKVREAIKKLHLKNVAELAKMMFAAYIEWRDSPVLYFETFVLNRLSEK